MGAVIVTGRASATYPDDLFHGIVRVEHSLRYILLCKCRAMAGRGAICRFVSLQFRTCAGADLTHGFPELSPALSSALNVQQQQQQKQQNLFGEPQKRTIITARVQNGRIIQAMKAVNRAVFAEKINKMWRDRTSYTPPAKQRVIDAKETTKRLRREAFNQKLRWAMQRKARYAFVSRV